MKYLIGDIPYEWLEEEEKSKSEDIAYLEFIVLQYQYNVWSTEKYDSSSRKDEFLGLVFISSGGDEESSCVDEQCGCYDPENWRQNHKDNIAHKGWQSEDHAGEKDGIFFLGGVDPEPEPKEHKEVKQCRQNLPLVSPKERPKYIAKNCPGTRQNTVWKMPRNKGEILLHIHPRKQWWEE